VDWAGHDIANRGDSPTIDLSAVECHQDSFAMGGFVISVDWITHAASRFTTLLLFDA
jgi:hypothetical protein